MTRSIIANLEIQKNLRKMQTKEIDFEDASYNIKQELAKITISDIDINSIHIISKGNKPINYIFCSKYVAADTNEELYRLSVHR